MDFDDLFFILLNKSPSNFSLRFIHGYLPFLPSGSPAGQVAGSENQAVSFQPAFPTRPTHGGRILRFFVNINPSEGRVWNIGEPFDVLMPRLAEGHRITPSHRGKVGRSFARMAGKIGLPIPDRSRYDEYMLHLHDWLKENSDFQQNAPKQELTFPPGCTWMVYTDGVPHAVLRGRYAVEQTFIVPPEALVTPAVAPIRVLEKVTGHAMAG